MKTIAYFKNLKESKSLFFRMFLLALLVVTASCSKDEDEVEPTPDPDAQFRVELVKIRATEISGEGNDAMEVYGEIDAALNIGTTSDSRELWSTDQENNFSVTENDSQITGTANFTVGADDVNGASIVVTGDLLEWDGGSSVDDMGEESSTISLSSISGAQEFQLTFSNGGGQAIQLTYRVSRL